MREQRGGRAEREVRDDPVGLLRPSQPAPVQVQQAHALGEAGPSQGGVQLAEQSQVALDRQHAHAGTRERNGERAAPRSDLDDELVIDEVQPLDERGDDSPVDEEVLGVATPALVLRTARARSWPGHGGAGTRRAS